MAHTHDTMAAVPLWITDAVGWLVIGTFVLDWLSEASERPGRTVGAAAWTGFGAFWLLLIPHFALVMRSPIETVLAALAVPACL